MNNIGLAVIADRLGVSANYLSGVFHKRVGVRFSTTSSGTASPRRAGACPLSEEPIADLARAVGFPNARYFAKRFGHHVGSPPPNTGARLSRRNFSGCIARLRTAARDSPGTENKAHA
jgi:AraC-like DNA-binding protein